VTHQGQVSEQAAGGQAGDGGWRHAWDGMVAAVGRDFADTKVTYGADPVAASDIRRFLEPLEFDCPLHYDREAAQAAGFADVTLPYTGVMTWSIPTMWSPGEPPLFDDDSRDAQPARSPINNADPGPAPPTSGFFATDLEMDFLRPVRAGERIARRGRTLLSCTPKETSVGRGAFLTWESEFINDHGEVLARMRTGTYAYQPHPARPRAADTERRETPARPGRGGPGMLTCSAAPPPGGQRYFEDARPGEEIKAVAFPLTVYRLVMAAGGNRDFNSIHHNGEYARSTGAPDMYASSAFLLGTWERAVRDWIGCAGTIRSIRGFRMRQFNVVGDTMRVLGRVLSADEADGTGLVTLELRSETSAGVTVGPGRVEVTLPLRAGNGVRNGNYDNDTVK
jgi:acyl dehydratase